MAKAVDRRFVAREVLNLGSGCPDWQGDWFWLEIPVHLWLLGHPFD
jgi:hypothetical protein